VIVLAATAITNVRVFDGERLREAATVVLEQATISARTSADGALRRVPPGSQARQIRRPVRERLRRPRLISELADSVSERSDTDGIVAEQARRLVESLNLPVDLIAHRDGMPRRRPASSCDT
jgi:hypothetical protein